MADESMHDAIRNTKAIGADAVALAEAYSPARFQRRAGAFALSAGVAMDLLLGWALELEADQVKVQKRLSVEKPSWTDSRRAGAAVDPGQHRQCPRVQRQEHRIAVEP